MTIFEDIRNAYGDYLVYLRSNPRFQLPESVHNPENSIGKVHASALGRCPRASALKRVKEVREGTSILHLMQQGVRDAEPVQEALAWRDPATLIEYSVEKDFLRGRIDAIYKDQIIEIKRRDAPGDSDMPRPKMTDIYQMLAYSWILNNETPILLLVTRFDLFLWQLRPVKEGFLLFDEKGYAFKSRINKPEYMNYTVMLHEANRHLSYLRQETDDDPMPDFLNAHNGYECFSWENRNIRPKKFAVPFKDVTGTTANIVPTCPFWCHGAIPESGMISVEEIEVGSKTYQVKK